MSFESIKQFWGKYGKNITAGALSKVLVSVSSPAEAPPLKPTPIPQENKIEHVEKVQELKDAIALELSNKHE